VGDECASGERDGEVEIELRADAHPPGTREHGYETIVGVEVRAAEMVRVPFDEHNIETELEGAPLEDVHVGAFGVVDPMKLIGNL
jgi:hypothetical protein